MSNSTQNDHETHTACIERIKKEGASATCCHCNPHDGCTLEMKPTQNDWAEDLNYFDFKSIEDRDKCLAWIETLLADARREKWIDSDCEHLWSSTTEGQRVRICLLCNREQVLATLREEEGAVK